MFLGAANDTNNIKTLLDDFKFEFTKIDDNNENVPFSNFLQDPFSEEFVGPQSGTSYDILKASNDRFHLKTVEGLPLRRMTANLFELAQSRTPQIHLKTKSIRGDQKECSSKKFSGLEENQPHVNKFDLRESELWDLREVSMEAECSSTSFLGNSNSKPPLEKVPPLLSNSDLKGFDIHQNHDQRETDSLFKVKLPFIFEDLSMEKFENFLPNEESLSSTPPSVERRISRRFYLRPDVVNGGSLFDNVEEQVESGVTYLRDDSLIDLDGSFRMFHLALLALIILKNIGLVVVLTFIFSQAKNFINLLFTFSINRIRRHRPAVLNIWKIFLNFWQFFEDFIKFYCSKYSRPSI